jgi:signal transduction histidine kinase
LKTKTFLLALLVALVLAVPAFAQGSAPPPQEPLVLTDEQGEYPLGLHMDILEDPGGELTIDDVTSPQYASQFTASQEDVPNYGYTSTVFWLRLRLRNEAHLTSEWLLEANFPNLNYIDLYLPAEGDDYSVKQSGALRSFDTRDIPYYHVVFELPLAYQDEQYFYIRVESGSSMTLAFTLWSPQAFAVNKFADMLMIGLFYGSLLIMLGYHLFLFYRLRESIYFHFVIFLASAILFFATYEGVADQYLWPGLSQHKRFLLTITMALFFMASMKFSDVFFEAKTRAPRVHQVFYLLIVFWGLMILIVPFNSYATMSMLMAPMIFLTPAFAALAGFYAWRKGFHQARFFLVSWLGFFLGVMMLDLVRTDFLPSTPLTERSYQAGLIWLVLLWSLALADRIEMLKKETEDANRKLLQSQSQLSQTLEGLPLGVVVYGIDRRPIYANPRAVNILSNPDRGIQAGATGRRTISEAIKYFSFRLMGSDQEYPVEKIPVWQAFEGQSAAADDIEADLIDRRVPLEVWANPIMDEHGRVESVVAAFQDITQRKQVEAELVEYRHQLERLVEQRTEQLSAANAQLQVENAERRRYEDMLRSRMEWLVVVNQVSQAVSKTSDLPRAYQDFVLAIKNLFGASDALLAELNPQSKEMKLLSHTCQCEEHGDLAGLAFQLPSAVLTYQHDEQDDLVVLRRDLFTQLDGLLGAHYQEAKNQILALVPLHCQENTFGLLGLEFLEVERLFSVEEIALIEKICLDITQVRNKALMEEQNRALIATEERTRLARDLHDSVTQMLFSASLVAEVLPQIWRREPKRALASLEELRRLTRGALAEMRTMLLELRPSAAIKTPLSDLLAQLTEAVTSRTDLPYQFYVEQIPPLPEDVHLGYYRIAQESLNNVVKHAKATLVTISLNTTSQISEPAANWRGELNMMICDNGCGFDPQDERAQHLGLAIMRERAATINAALTIDSQMGHGTTVTLTWHN